MSHCLCAHKCLTSNVGHRFGYGAETQSATRHATFSSALRISRAMRHAQASIRKHTLRSGVISSRGRSSEHTSGPLSKTFGWLATAVMSVAAIAVVLTTVRGGG